MLKTIMLRSALLAITCSISMAAYAISESGETPGSNSPEGPKILDEIVVTAQKRYIGIMQTNIAASALGSTELKEKSVSQLSDLQNATPSLSVIDQGFTQSINIRGIGLSLVQPNVAPGVATYKDGVFLPTQTTLSSPFFDIQDVQVLRGPQGTFVGQTATGGAVFVNSKSPDLSGGVSGDLTASYGNDSDLGLQGAVNLPINDTLAARFAFHGEKRDSFYKNINPTNTQQPGSLKTANWRLSVLWKPTDSLKVLFKNEYNWDSTNGYPYQPIPGTTFSAFAPRQPYVINLNQPETNHETYNVTSINIDEELPDGITLRSNTGYQYNHQLILDDTDASPLPIASQRNNYTERVWTEDLSLVSPDDALVRWVVCGTYINYKSQIPLIVNFPGLNVGADSFTAKSDYGVFGSATYNILPKLEIELGVRYSHDAVDTTGEAVFTPPGPPFGVLSLNVPHYTDNVGTGKVGLNWKPDSTNLVYAFAAKGYKPGGGSAGAVPTFAPENVYDYELGWKATLLDGHLRTQIGGFYMDYKDYQLTVFNPAIGASGIVNATSPSTIRGIEAQGQLKLENASIDATLSYVDSQIGSLAPQVDPRSLPNAGSGLGPQCTAPGVPGNCFNYAPYIHSLPDGPNIYSPKWTANVGVQYGLHVAHDDTLTPRVDLTYMSSQWATFFEAPVDRLEARFLVNMLLTYRHSDWSVQAYGTNVFERVYVAGFSGNNQFYGKPRQFGVRIAKDF